MIYLLPNDELLFPNPRNGEKDGLFAVGGDLSPERLELAYENVNFPWFPCRAEYTALIDENGKPMITWYCPMERYVIFPEKIHISHSMRNLINSGKYRVSIDQAFDAVIENCSQMRINQEYAWLGPEMVSAYKTLHHRGLTHSVEVWDNVTGALIGGLYGVRPTATCFCGESMFSLAPSASKLALITLARHMQSTGGKMIDCQFHTPHLESMGGESIGYEEYMGVMQGGD